MPRYPLVSDVNRAVDDLPDIIRPELSSTDILPHHLYRATSVTESGGFITDLVDLGSAGKDLAADFGNVSTVQTDGNGRAYLNGDEFFRGAVASDWRFLHDGTDYLIWLVHYDFVSIKTNSGSSTTVGVTLGRASDALGGFPTRYRYGGFSSNGGGGAYPYNAFVYRDQDFLRRSLTTLQQRQHLPFGTTYPKMQAVFRTAGGVPALSATSANTPSYGVDPWQPLELRPSATGLLYEMGVVKRAVSERKVWALTNYLRRYYDLEDGS